MKNNILSKGDIIKTSLSDSTMVLKVHEDEAILFSGRQFVVAHGIEIENGKLFWRQGDYYDELDELLSSRFKKNQEGENEKRQHDIDINEELENDEDELEF
ncbi:hypothetical protein [Alkaliphilus sp. B6464]|uniref:hypothetical protein n=1 Tax=Alkaliphilus sp. B6464 TaxID=2731219 RepID=UPI001BAE5340|nr:hypothetical protein [Alkaliphilus sp. B6464]QUH20389.1 hypothetical protein HYG84_11105 [Alkaliphilus sp. B6464]